MNSYSVTFDYLWYSVRYLMNKPEGKKTTIRRYLAEPLRYNPKTEGSNPGESPWHLNR